MVATECCKLTAMLNFMWLSDNLTTALIAAAVSLLGGIASVIIARHTSKREMDMRLAEMRQENKRTYSEKLLDKRLEVYPALNVIIMEFMASIREDGMKHAHLAKLQDDLREWSIAHSILLSFKSRAEFSQLTKRLRKVRHVQADQPDIGTLKEIIDHLGKLRLTLKGDLGIFLVEFENADQSYFQTYDQLFSQQIREEQAQEESAPQDEDRVTTNDVSEV